MTIRRWDPLRDLLMLQERMNRLFEEGLRSRPEIRTAVLDRGAWTPLADVHETQETFVLTVELPGLLENDVEVEVEARELTLRGRRLLRGPAPDNYHRMERTFGSFSRTFEFTSDVDPERVLAQLRDGILRIELTKLARRAAGRTHGEGRR